MIDTDINISIDADLQDDTRYIAQMLDKWISFMGFEVTVLAIVYLNELLPMAFTNLCL